MKGPPAALIALIKGKPSPDREPDGDGADEKESPDDYADLLKTAFPDQDWDEDRIAAFKEAVHSCMEK